MVSASNGLQRALSALTAGKNSRRIVASIGMFPPRPSPHNAARAQMAPKLLGTPAIAKLRPSSQGSMPCCTDQAVNGKPSH